MCKVDQELLRQLHFLVGSPWLVYNHKLSGHHLQLAGKEGQERDTQLVQICAKKIKGCQTTPFFGGEFPQSMSLSSKLYKPHKYFRKPTLITHSFSTLKSVIDCVILPEITCIVREFILGICVMDELRGSQISQSGMFS